MERDFLSLGLLLAALAVAAEAYGVPGYARL